MPNPALLLADQFDEWETTPTGSTLRQVRQAGGSLLDKQLQVAGWLQEIVQEIDDRSDELDDYRHFVPDWWDAVFLPGRGWDQQNGSSQPDRVIQPQHIAALRGLGRYLEATGFKPVPVAPGALDTVRNALDGLTDLLNDPELGLDDARRTYLFSLIAEIRRTLDASANGVTLNLYKQINQLRGALEHIADGVADKTMADKVRGFGKALYPVIVTAGVAVGWAAGLGADVLTITQGPGH